MKHYFYLLLLAAMTLFSSCRSDVVYSRFYSIPSAKWHQDSVLRFDFDIVDSEPTYQILVYVRHNERYPYQNMWLFLSDSVRSDTIEFYMADDRGRWLGDRHNGYIEMPVLFESEKHFSAPGLYSLSVQQAMRDSILKGITDVGIEVVANR